jgi:hypothetical protein
MTRHALQIASALGVILASALISAPPAKACGWWSCDYRTTYRAYRKPTRVYGYLGTGPSRATLRGAPPVPGGDVGLKAPYASGPGLLQSAIPKQGPVLFGTPAAVGYYYTAGPVRRAKWRRTRY